MAEKYISMSTYHFSGNNPVRFIDSDGMQFSDPNDKKQAEADKASLKKMSEEKAKSAISLQKSADRWAARAEKSKGIISKFASWVSKQNQNAANDAKQSSELLSAVSEGIGRLIDDKNQNYRYSDETGKGSSIAFLSTDKDGTVVIPYISSANRIHETVHAIQQNNGDIKGISGTNMWHGINIQHEIQAYSVQFAYDRSSLSFFGASSFKSINESWVRSLTTDGKYYPYADSPLNNQYLMFNNLSNWANQKNSITTGAIRAFFDSIRK